MSLDLNTYSAEQIAEAKYNRAFIAERDCKIFDAIRFIEEAIALSPFEAKYYIEKERLKIILKDLEK